MPLLAFGQNPPSANSWGTANLNQNSGSNQIIVPNVSDGDNYTQNISVTATSSDETIVVVDSGKYVKGQTFAILYVSEKNKNGNAVITVKLNDGDGEKTVTGNVQVASYTQNGARYRIYDIVFWQNAVPDESTTSVYDIITPNLDMPWQDVDFNSLPLTVGESQGKDKFYTATIWGYLIPPATGDYKFTLHSGEPSDLYISPDADMTHKVKYFTADWHGDSTTNPITLQAGKVYAIYIVNHYIVGDKSVNVQWEGPGITKQIIPSANILHTYDLIRPVSPATITKNLLGVSDVRFSWTAGTDNAAIAGYNVYVDGVKMNNSLLTDRNYSLSGLTAATLYDISVTTVDKMGNESFIKSILPIKTLNSDSEKPTAPISAVLLQKTGQAFNIRWSGATDNQVVIGYNVYVDGVKYNSDYILADSIIITGLTQRTDYHITIESVDGAFNLSPKSLEFIFRTGDFDPNGLSLGDKHARLKVYMENISSTEGIGVNPDYGDNSGLYTSPIKDILFDLKPGTIRWGGIGANSIGLSDASGAGKTSTYAKMLNLAISLNSYFSLTVGVENNVDFMKDPNTFLNLLEYLAGPSTSTWGKVRADEGFTEPLLQKSKGIILELGNEVWGASAHNAEIGADYVKYATWCRQIATLIKSSDLYKANKDKITISISGRDPDMAQSYGLTEKALTGDKGELDCFAVSGYLGGNLNYNPGIPMGTSELEYYKYRIAQATTNINGLYGTMQYMIVTNGAVKPFYMYEANATTSSYNGRLGQAIVMTDYLTTSMKFGSLVPTIFHLTGGEWRITQPSEGYKRLPLFVTSKFINTYCKGNVLKTKLESNGVIYNGDGSKLVTDPVGSIAFSDGTNYSVLLTSRDFENDYTVQLDLPDDFAFTGEVKQYKFSGTDFSSRDITVDSTSQALNDSMFVTVPKYGMLLLSFKGNDMQFNRLPLGFYKQIPVDSIKIVPKDANAVITNKGTIYMDVKIFPANAFNRNFALKTLQNNVGAAISPYLGGTIKIKGSGACNGNGDIIFQVTSSDNANLTDEHTVNISMQGTNCPSSVKDITEQSYKVYPNPVDDKLTVASGSNEKIMISLYNSSGVCVFNQANISQTEIEMQNFSTGIYFLKVVNNSESKIYKIIKN
jgi:hypothetical protein